MNDSTPSNTDVKGYFTRFETMLNEQETLADDMKELKTEATGKGIDVKAMLYAVKQKRKPMEKALKEKINFYMNADGQGDLFAGI